ncbi:MAG: hypothetical protein IPL83_07030 [Bdellovibrionales bacterium]|nr:hypothetical protein [Bdellovibrionales bacterium]
MAKLDDLLEKASKGPKVPSVRTGKRGYGIKETMASLKASEEKRDSSKETSANLEDDAKPLIVTDPKIEFNLDIDLNDRGLSADHAGLPLASDMVVFNSEASDVPLKKRTQIANTNSDDSEHKFAENADLNGNHLGFSKSILTPKDPSQEIIRTQKANTNNEHKSDTSKEQTYLDLLRKANTNSEHIPLEKRTRIANTVFDNSNNSSNLDSDSRSETEQNAELNRTQIANTSRDVVALNQNDSEHKKTLKRTQSLSEKHKRQPQYSKNYSEFEILDAGKSLTNANTDSEHKANTKRTQHESNTDSEHNANTKRTLHWTQNPNTPSSHIFRTEHSVQNLSGNRLKIFESILELCLQSRSRTISTTHEYLAKASNIRLGSVKTTTQRMKLDGFLTKRPLGLGRGCLIEFGVPDQHFDGYLAIQMTSKANTKTPQSEHKANTLPDTTPSSSSSVNLIKKATTTNNTTSETNPSFSSTPIDLPIDWSDIQIPPSLQDIGFGRTQIRQLFHTGTLLATEVQDSLEAFAYDLDAGQVKSRGSKLGFLMGILRRSGAYVSEAYMSELKMQVEANELRRRETLDLRRKTAETALVAAATEIFQKLTDDEKRHLVPESHLAKLGSVSYQKLVLARIIENERSRNNNDTL